MDEARRRHYLEALGIELWRSRDASPVPVAGTADGTPPDPRGQPAPDVPPQRVAPAAGVTEPSPGEPDTAALDWPGLEARVAGCRACGLCEGRTRTVFGAGARDAEWMIVGEAPGAEEDRRGEPFVGAAGKLLDRMLEAIGLARDRVFIANTLKCRPPGNRDPRPEELAACRPYLERQIALLAPRLLLVVGRVAAQALLASEHPLGRLRGRVHELPGHGIPVVVTYHPAYLLRSPEQKRQAWRDLLLARSASGG